jgi:hypothetical protein
MNAREWRFRIHPPEVKNLKVGLVRLKGVWAGKKTINGKNK